MHLMVFFISDTTKNKSVFPPEIGTDIQVKGKKKHKKHIQFHPIYYIKTNLNNSFMKKTSMTTKQKGFSPEL